MARDKRASHTGHSTEICGLGSLSWSWSRVQPLASLVTRTVTAALRGVSPHVSVMQPTDPGQRHHLRVR